MKKAVKIIAVTGGLFLLIVSMVIVDLFVYPFTSDKPNYADVERAFDKIVIPEDWEEISSRENKGIKGRACDPFDKSGCFSKSKTFKVPYVVNSDNINVLLQDICIKVSYEKNTNTRGASGVTNFRCSTGVITFAGSLREAENEIYLVSRTY